jgi:hypothetical protein
VLFALFLVGHSSEWFKRPFGCSGCQLLSTRRRRDGEGTLRRRTGRVTTTVRIVDEFGVLERRRRGASWDRGHCERANEATRPRPLGEQETRRREERNRGAKERKPNSAIM